MHRLPLMRVDFVLPAGLAIALAVMVMYASTDSTVELPTVDISCDNTAMVARLRDLPEASGLTASLRHAQLFWTHNDSAEPYVYGVAADGSVRGRVRIAGASLKDWEAITTAPCPEGSCLFVGDIGDNDRARQSIIVYRTVEPDVSAEASAEVVVAEAVYPEGPQDAEAMFVADGKLYVVTKGEGTPVRLYRFPNLDGRRMSLELVATLIPAPKRKTYDVTDAALSPDGRWVALRTNDLLLFYEGESLLSGTPGIPRAFDLRGLGEPQGEGIAWADQTTLMLVGEAEGAGTFAKVACAGPLTQR